MEVLVTRPQPEAEHTAMLLREMDVRATLAPMLRIMPVSSAAEEPRVDDVQAIVLTSANAARALIQRPLGAMLMERDRPLFAVGEATAQAARDAGFGRVEAAGGDVEGLVRVLAGRVDPGRGAVIYPCGEHRAHDLVAELARIDLDCRPVVVYAARAETRLPRDVEHGLRDRRFDAVLFYSPRTAGIFVDLVEAYGLADRVGHTRALCLSPAVAGRAQALRWAGLDVAARPDQEALLAVVRRLQQERMSLRPGGT
ncbi:MAG: uroporphyrinogen-III synthase [Alphaproteobacteria bacterium]